MGFLKRFFLSANESDGDFRRSFACLWILALIHLSLDLYLGKQAHLMMGLLLWAAIGLLIWDRRTHFKESRDSASFFVGCALIAALLVISVVHPGDKFRGFFPLLAFFGWFLIFVGAAQSRFYLKEFMILAVFGLPKLVPETAFGLAPLTAKFSAFILWYLGYPVSLEGVHIGVPKGGVEVVPACSGISLITHMLSVSIIFLCVFPTPRLRGILFTLLAVALGFLMNAVRVAVLAVLSPPQSSDLFYYWHSANGASVFVLLTLFLYGTAYFCCLKPVKQL